MTTKTAPLHPEVVVKFAAGDGGPYSIVGRCVKAAKRDGLDRAKVREFAVEATGGDYNHLLKTCMKWFTCD